MTKVRIQRLANGAGLELPAYATSGAAGLDLRAAEAVTIRPGQRHLVPTGLAIALPPRHEAQVRPRSGLAVKHGVTVLNAPGTIDEDYRGEIKVPLINHGHEDFVIQRGDRIAQMVIAPVVQVTLEEVQALDQTARGSGGFGSSGEELVALSPEELERYARHIVLPEVGGPGQQKLGKARVLVIGAGGLGAPLLQYLAAAGVGTLGIIDHDTVSLSNLQRQTIHSMAFLGKPKVESAAHFIKGLNPHVKVEIIAERLSPANAMEVIGRYDVVADASDNFATRFLVSDACYFARKPLVTAAVGQFDGQISTFKPWVKDKDGNPLPTYRCFIGDLPEPGLFPACEAAGILGALPGIVGSMQAMEVIKEILDIGESLAGRILMYDALLSRFFEARLAWNPDNPLTGTHPKITAIRPENYKHSSDITP